MHTSRVRLKGFRIQNVRPPGLRPALMKVAGAMLLAIAALAMLAPVLKVSAGRETERHSQLPAPTPDKLIAAPSRRIEPVSVTVVNFRKLALAEAKKAASGTKEKSEETVIHPPLTLPEADDVSVGPVEQTAPSAPQPEGGGPLIPSPQPAANFLALEDNGGSIPPDTTGAVGLDKMFVTLNGRYRVQNKATGATQPAVSISTFWAPLNTPTPVPPIASVSGVFDPRVQYDPYNNRWIVAAVSNSRSASSSVVVGISATSDPQGTFTLYRFVVGCAGTDTGCDTDGEWADFPMLGFNKNWVAVGWNQFDSNSAATFVAGKMLILDYPALRAGTSTSSITTVTTGGNFCMHPATTLSSTEETLYVPAHTSSAGAQYRLHSISGTPSAPVLSLDPTPNTRPGGAWTQPGGDTLPQTCVGTPGTTCPTTPRRLDSGDSHIRSNVVFRNGSIWYAQTVGLPAGRTASTIDHTAAQWTRINTSGSFVDGGRVEDAAATVTSGEWYAYPSIGVNANNDVLLGFSNLAGTHFARAGYTFRAGTDTAGTMRDPLIFKEGEDYYSKEFSGDRNRWGDYSHTVVDPSNDLDMWTIQEYAAQRLVQDSQETTNNSRWGTWWAKVTDIGSPPPSPTPTPSPTPPPTPPPNDNLANAQTITNCSGSVTGTNILATREAGEPSHDPAGNPGAASVWYHWTAPATGSVTIDTIGSNYDTMLGVYTGTAVNALTAIGKNDDIDTQGGNVSSSVTFSATAGTLYKIAVDGWGGDVGNIVLNWNQSNCPPPSAATVFVAQGTNELPALDSVTFVRGPFTLTDNSNFSSDRRTRIIFFTSNLGFAQPTQPNVTTLAVVIAGTEYPVENVGPVTGIDASYIVFRLPDLAPGTYPVTVRLNAVNSSNSPTLTIVSSPNGPAAPVPRKLTSVLYPLLDLIL